MSNFRLDVMVHLIAGESSLCSVARIEIQLMHSQSGNYWLRNRLQRVCNKAIQSTWEEVWSGVSRGSVFRAPVIRDFYK